MNTSANQLTLFPPGPETGREFDIEKHPSGSSNAEHADDPGVGTKSETGLFDELEFEADYGFNDSNDPAAEIDLELDLDSDFTPSPVNVRLCSLDDIYKLTLRPTHGSEPDRDKTVTFQLKRNNGLRELRRLPKGWENHIAVLRCAHPNAEAFLDLLEDMCTLAQRGNGVLQMGPVVLDGPPGAGKTVLTEDLARMFSGGYTRISMAGIEMGSEIGGADPGWANARIGKVLATLAYGKYCNPVFLLDEIDKTKGSEQFSPWASLHDLLEPASAKTFRDRSFDSVAISAQHILWLATSNEFKKLVPDAIASRFTVVHMPLPTDDQVAAIVRSVWRRLQVTHPVCDTFTLAGDMHVHLCGTSPRAMGQRLHRACARAARENANLVEGKHLPPAMNPIRRPMGFFP